jgi:hypothetical protein
VQFPTTLEKGLSKLMSLKDAYGGMLSQVSRMVGMGSGSGQEDMLDSMLGKLEQLKVGVGRGALLRCSKQQCCNRCRGRPVPVCLHLPATISLLCHFPQPDPANILARLILPPPLPPSLPPAACG